MPAEDAGTHAMTALHVASRDETRRSRARVDDMVVSASFSAWAPLLEGTPQLAHELYHWEAH